MSPGRYKRSIAWRGPWGGGGGELCFGDLVTGGMEKREGYLPALLSKAREH